MGDGNALCVCGQKGRGNFKLPCYQDMLREN